MASFPSHVDEVRADLRRALGSPPPSDPLEHNSSFEAIARALLEEVAVRPLARQFLARLADLGLTDPEELARADHSALVIELDDSPARVRKWLAPLKALAQELIAAGGSDAIDRMPTEELRAAWRNVRGLGSKTADAILLRAVSRPVYPLDRATYRIFTRHGWLDGTETYDEAAEVIQSTFAADAAAIREFTTWMAQLGKSHCRASRPLCDHCPLREWLAPGGPLGCETV
jgi:endonuclease-3 related protein